MRSTALHLVLVFSLAFNIAFAGIWIYHRTRPRPHARGPLPGAGPGSLSGPGSAWAQFDLGPEQERRVRESWRRVEGRLQELRQETGEQRDRLFDLLQADPPDKEAILEAQQRIEATQEQMREAVVAQMMETRAQLNAEQRRKWVEAMRSHGQQLGARRWRNGRGRPGGRRSSDDRRPRRGADSRQRPPMGRGPEHGGGPPPGPGLPPGLPPGPPPAHDEGS